MESALPQASTTVYSFNVEPNNPRWDLIERFLDAGVATPATISHDEVLAQRKLHGTEFVVTAMPNGNLRLSHTCLVNPLDEVDMEAIQRHIAVAVLLDSGARIAEGDQSTHGLTWLGLRARCMDDRTLDTLVEAGLLMRPLQIHAVESLYSAGF